MFLQDPVKVRLTPEEEIQAEPHLRYRDLRAKYELARVKKSTWLMQKLGPEGFQEHLAEIKSRIDCSMIQRDEQGAWTYSGMIPKLREVAQLSVDGSAVEYPVGEVFGWRPGIEVEPRPYQELAAEALISARHGAVEMPTGSGKSLVIAMVLRRLGLRAVVGVPSVNLLDQMHRDLSRLLDCSVGRLGDGHRELDRHVVVAVAASLARMEPGSKDHLKLTSNRGVLVIDESHLWAADTLCRSSANILGTIPYRFSVSATQTRTDGLEKLLTGLTGEIIFRMSSQQAIQQGWLARPRVTVIQIPREQPRDGLSPLQEAQLHLLFNRHALAAASNLANKCAQLRKPTIILVEQVEQFSRLLPLLRHKTAFAHGPLQKTPKNTPNRTGQKISGNEHKVPEEYRKSEPTELVERFNRGEIPILVGTSCISTGTDTRVTEALIYLQGGMSEIQVSQAIGRGTRGGHNPAVKVFNPWTGAKKLDCLVFDFDVADSKMMHRHADARRAVYRQLTGEDPREVRA